MDALILCAGLATRWQQHSGELPKQLAVINRETLLERSVRLLRERGVQRITIVANDARLKHPGCEFFKPTHSRFITETLLSTRELWRESIYSRCAKMRFLLAFKGGESRFSPLENPPIA